MTKTHLKFDLVLGKYHDVFDIFMENLAGPAWWGQKAGDVFYVFAGFPVLSGKHNLPHEV